MNFIRGWFLTSSLKMFLFTLYKQVSRSLLWLSKKTIPSENTSFSWHTPLTLNIKSSLPDCCLTWSPISAISKSNRKVSYFTCLLYWKFVSISLIGFQAFKIGKVTFLRSRSPFLCLSFNNCDGLRRSWPLSNSNGFLCSSFSTRSRLSWLWHFLYHDEASWDSPSMTPLEII